MRAAGFDAQANRGEFLCIKSYQSWPGMVHFFAMFLRARWSSFITASSFGNEPRAFVTFRIFDNLTAQDPSVTELDPLKSRTDTGRVPS